MSELVSIYDQVANSSIKKGAVLSTFYRVAYYNANHNGDGMYLQILNERLAGYQYVIYFPYYSCLRVPINDRIKWFADAGLLIRWERKYFKLNFIKPKYMESGLVKIRPLKLFHIEGVFQICGVLYFIAAIIFAIEYIGTVVILRCNDVRNNIKYSLPNLIYHNAYCFT